MSILRTNLQSILIVLLIAAVVFQFFWDFQHTTSVPVEVPSRVLDSSLPDVSPHVEHIEKHENDTGLNLSRLGKLILRHESKWNRPYLDSEGIVTIGVGRSLQTNGISVVELHAILPDVDYLLLLKDCSVRNGRVYIPRLGVAQEIFRNPLTEHDIALLLSDDLRQASKDAETIFAHKWHEIDAIRREAILDMVYNLGLPHFKTFVKFIDAVKVGDWTKAGTELLSSVAAHKNPTRYHWAYLVITTGDSKYFDL